VALSYQFSVGTIQVGSNDLGTVTSINVTYDGDPQSFYGGDYRLPIAVELGNRSGQITTSTTRFDTADTVLDNRYLNVTLGTGANSGGLTGTINNCKVSNYNVASAQADYVLSDWTLLITSQDAEQSVKGGDIPAWV
jgi:hypothetical protein